MSLRGQTDSRQVSLLLITFNLSLITSSARHVRLPHDFNEAHAVSVVPLEPKPRYFTCELSVSGFHHDVSRTLTFVFKEATVERRGNATPHLAFPVPPLQGNVLRDPPGAVPTRAMWRGGAC